MNELIWMDHHVHTTYSPDADDTMEAMCERAVQKGLACMSITDHCECHTYWSDDYAGQIRASLAQAQALKAHCAEQGLLLVHGVEMGQPMQDLRAAQDLLALPWDVVLASLHNNPDAPDFYFLDYAHMTFEQIHKLLKQYFTCLYEMVRWNQFDVLAHMVYPIRYISGDYGIPIDLSPYWDVISATLQTLAQNGKALEINTSGMRQPIGACIPDAPIVRRFRELGGQLISIGSDAHRTADLGAGLRDGYALARQCGFTEICYFQNRTPYVVPLSSQLDV